MRIPSVVFLTLLLPATAGSTAAQTTFSGPEFLLKGRLIYEAGRLGSGEPLRADRDDGVAATGQAAACINCHQRSGLGLFEGTNLVPPVTGPSLFSNAQPRTHATRRAKGIDHEEFPHLTRPPYNDATVAKALREGVSPNGYRFQYLMPRYALNEADMTALVAYLRQLSSKPSKGVDDATLHFATIIAPGQEPARRQALIDVLQACFRERHPPGQDRRSWQLHVWDLEGAADTWDLQLATKYARQPVFAFVSGLGSDEWKPVHAFAERERIPTLFANVDVGIAGDRGDYNFYFSKGVILDAEVIAGYLAEGSAPKTNRVVQLRLDRGAGSKAASALRLALKGGPIAVEDRILTHATAAAIRDSLAGLSAGDALVVWLGRDELSALPAVPVPQTVGQIIFSGWHSGFEYAPLPVEWKRTALMVYPVDAPQRREARMQFNLRPWLAKHSIPAADEMLLGNTLAACNLLSEGMQRLRGQYFRDYLVELTENYPTGMGNAPAPEAFPRFVIGPGQRYSSKGAYLVRFAAPDSNELELVHDWLVPN